MRLQNVILNLYLAFILVLKYGLIAHASYYRHTHREKERERRGGGGERERGRKREREREESGYHDTTARSQMMTNYLYLQQKRDLDSRTSIKTLTSRKPDTASQ